MQANSEKEGGISLETKSFDLTKTIFWTILHRIIVVLMVVGSVASTACMVYSVILRYVFKGNFYGSDEVIMLFAFWLYFMGAAYGSFGGNCSADPLWQKSSGIFPRVAGNCSSWGGTGWDCLFWLSL